MTPTERRALHSAAIVEAWEWIDTYCPHYATQGRDWQTTDNMSAASRVMAKRLPAAWMISNMDAYIIKLTVIAALLITIVLLIDDLIRHPVPDAVWVDTPDGIQLRFTRPLPR